MQQIGKTEEQLPAISRELLPEDTTKKNEISIYGEGKVSSKIFADCIVRIKKAFPDLPVGWYDLLEEFIDEEKFTDQRLIDATKNLIRNCKYPKPAIAEVLSYDRKKKAYDYYEMLELTKDLSPESRKRFYENYNYDIKSKRYIEK